MLRLNLKSRESLMLQVVGMRNKYVFALCLTLWAGSAFTARCVCFMGAAWSWSPLRDRAFRFFPPLSPSCPKKNGSFHQGRL